MTNDKWEVLIARRFSDIERLNGYSDQCADMLMREMWRDAARCAAVQAAEMVALRSPETVRAMEIDRGLC